MTLRKDRMDPTCRDGDKVTLALTSPNGTAARVGVPRRRQREPGLGRDRLRGRNGSGGSSWSWWWGAGIDRAPPGPGQGHLRERGKYRWQGLAAALPSLIAGDQLRCNPSDAVDPYCSEVFDLTHW